MASDSFELEFLEKMAPSDRGLFLLGIEGKEAVKQLELLGYRLKQLRQDEAFANRMAKQYVEMYNDEQQEGYLVAVEQYAELVTSYGKYRKYILVEIREQRKRVQWLRMEYQNKMEPKS